MPRGNLACRVALDSHIENITPSTPTGRTTVSTTALRLVGVPPPSASEVSLCSAQV
jgi:hypothetical protein